MALAFASCVNSVVGNCMRVCVCARARSVLGQQTTSSSAPVNGCRWCVLLKGIWSAWASTGHDVAYMSCLAEDLMHCSRRCGNLLLLPTAGTDSCTLTCAPCPPKLWPRCSFAGTCPLLFTSHADIEQTRPGASPERGPRRYAGLCAEVLRMLLKLLNRRHRPH